ncbi:hypothetical protein [Lactiplantibacillus plantarum]|uniref:hypothetical protein n=1 Tax=Lactiplantibacillus plantarum TaxID=1590 RepID=UPI000FEFEFB1|nr:hypothetical protein [Lactiplantibacillus plantarum]RWZ42815.1 hypothetical protein EQG58_15425 [Lactiplantibacillus plantarum]
MKKFVLFSLFSMLVITTVGSLKSQASATKSGNEINNQNSFFDKAYQQGRAKGIINDSNMTYDEFISLCKNSVFPAYLQASQTDSTLTFEKYIAADHYEVPDQQPETPLQLSLQMIILIPCYAQLLIAAYIHSLLICLIKTVSP